MPLDAQQMDTLKVSGFCTHVGMTGSIIATTYWRFKIKRVLEGQFDGKEIVFESSINSRQHLLLDQVQLGDQITLSMEAIFAGTEVPVSRYFRCKSKLLEITLQKSEAEWPVGKKIVNFRYIPDP